jgi:hypothetical protein
MLKDYANKLSQKYFIQAITILVISYGMSPESLTINQYYKKVSNPDHINS